MRLSDADREQLISTLSAHAGEGRLTVEELERRVELATAAETHEQASALLADLPPLSSPPAPLGRRRSRSRPHGEVTTPEPGWNPTDERFRDPRSQRILRVWVDSAGGRHYVPEPGL